MRYLVCGMHRTGTSALVNAVVKSSALTALVDEDVEQLIRSRETDPTYDPNPDGYFCHGSMTAPLESWIDRLADNMVAKVSPIAIGYGIPAGDWTVILTDRDRTETETSMQRAFGADIADQRWTERASAETILRSTPNVTLGVVNFADLVNDPTGTFTTLAANGWPIDPSVAAATIDSSLYRNR